MKITIKTIILVALVIFNLVIIISNFTTYEGLETNSKSESENEETKETKEKTVEDLQEATEPTKEDIKYGIVGEGHMTES
jgi:regulatory protein YycH of two-component signal transduction system YycFG